MRQITVREPFNIQQKEVEKPEIIKDTDVLLKITNLGICGTDIHAYAGNQPFFKYPRVLGHEIGAVVEQVGNQVKNIKIGDHATVIPYIYCEKCSACRRGKTNCCESLSVLGVHLNGAMGEYLVVSEKYVIVNNKLSGKQLASVEPLAIGAHAVQRSQVTSKDTVLVIGAGPIGIGVARFAKLQGATVALLDLNNERLNFGEDWAKIDTSLQLGENLVEKIREVFNNELPTIVFDATGNQQSMENAFHFVANGGTLIFVGLMTKTITFDDPEFHAKELTLKSSRNATEKDFELVIEQIENGNILDGYVTREVPFTEVVSYFTSQNHHSNKAQIIF